jgi:hypothetical protein
MDNRCIGDTEYQDVQFNVEDMANDTVNLMRWK